MVENCRSATIFARTIDPYEISALRSLQAFSAAATIGRAGGGLPGVGAAFLRTPLLGGCIILQHPPVGGPLPPLERGVSPPRGGERPFLGAYRDVDNQWTTNGQPTDNQKASQKTSHYATPLTGYDFIDIMPTMKRKKATPPPLAIDQLISLPRAAELADVSEGWLRQLVVEGKVRGVKIGRNYLVDLESAKAFTRHPFLGRPRKSDKPRGGGPGGGTPGGKKP